MSMFRLLFLGPCFLAVDLDAYVETPLKLTT